MNYIYFVVKLRVEENIREKSTRRGGNNSISLVGPEVEAVLRTRIRQHRRGVLKDAHPVLDNIDTALLTTTLDRTIPEKQSDRRCTAFDRARILVGKPEWLSYLRTDLHDTDATRHGALIAA